jgi:hypothetical protein
MEQQTVEEYEQQGLEKYSHELKKETLEEAAERMWNNPNEELTSKSSFIKGAKWQAERMYSKEEVDVLIHDLINKFTDWSGSYVYNDKLIEIYKQLKKK